MTHAQYIDPRPFPLHTPSEDAACAWCQEHVPHTWGQHHRACADTARWYRALLAEGRRERAVEETPPPQHGEQRGSSRRVTEIGASHTLINATTGEPILVGPLSGHTYSVSERYCGVCKAWKAAKGIIGGMLCVDCGTAWHDEVAA